MISSSSRAGSSPAWRERVADHRQEMAVAQLHRREVDRDVHLPAALLPQAGLPAGLAQDPVAQRPDQARGLGQGDELAGHDQSALGMVPAHERFHPGEAPGRELELRLVVQHELPFRQRLAELALEPPARLRRLVHGGLEEMDAGAAVGLGPVECQVRVPEQDVGLVPVLREQGDAQAGRGLHLVAVEREGCCEGGQDLVGQGGDIVGLADRGVDDGELVPAQPGQGVGGAHGSGDPLRHGPQEEVARGVAQRVVHLLEAVEIEKGHRHHLALALRGDDRPLEPVEEQQPVGIPVRSSWWTRWRRRSSPRRLSVMSRQVPR